MRYVPARESMFMHVPHISSATGRSLAGGTCYVWPCQSYGIHGLAMHHKSKHNAIKNIGLPMEKLELNACVSELRFDLAFTKASLTAS